MGKSEVWLGTLALMVLKTLDSIGPQHGYGIARRIDKYGPAGYQPGDPLSGALETRAGRRYLLPSGGSRITIAKAKFYQITKRGRKQLAAEVHEWQQMTEIIARFLTLPGEAQ